MLLFDRTINKEQIMNKKNDPKTKTKKVKKAKQEIDVSKFYDELYFLFNYYNEHLFENKLPKIVISIRAKANSAGYFSPERLTSMSTKKPLHEIALNPAILNRKTIEIFAIIAHEMAHLWQQVSGKPSKNGYHNKEWANKMEEIGLPPSDTGKPGGNRTGSNMFHYIEKAGNFEKVTNKLLKAHKFNFFYEIPKKKKSTESKNKFTCAICGCNAWGKADLEIMCVSDNRIMEIGL